MTLIARGQPCDMTGTTSGPFSTPRPLRRTAGPKAGPDPTGNRLRAKLPVWQKVPQGWGFCGRSTEHRLRCETCSFWPRERQGRPNLHLSTGLDAAQGGGALFLMPVYSIRYHFRQVLHAPARAAFAWCTDFVSEDEAFYPKGVRRTIRWLSPDTVILTDVRRPPSRRTRVSRLVRIDPGSMSWTNTHITGPYRHSQFWYRIVADSRERSHLEFEGFRLERHPGPLSAREIARRAEVERCADAALWRAKIAPALRRDRKRVLAQGRPAYGRQRR